MSGTSVQTNLYNREVLNAGDSLGFSICHHLDSDMELLNKVELTSELQVSSSSLLS